MLLSVAITLWLVGLLMFLAGWLFFRHPGQRFWVVAPITRAHQFLRVEGVLL